MNRQEKQLFALFRQDWAIPDGVQSGLERSYEQIRQQCREQEEPMKTPVKHTVRILLIAAIFALLAVSAAAIALHTDFFRQAFGTGAGSTEQTTVTYDDTSYTLPAVERVEVDEEAAEEAVGAYVTDAETNRTAQVNGYTITVDSYMLDENGCGVLTYTLENPDGLDDLVREDTARGVYYRGWTGERISSGVLEPIFELDGEMLDWNTYLDVERSTETTACLTVYFSPFERLETADLLTMHIDGYTTAEGQGTSFDDDAGVITLPVSKELVPAAQYTDAETGIAVSLSPVGMVTDLSHWKMQNDLDGERTHPTHKIEDEDGDLVPTTILIYVTADRIVLHYADGGEYVVIGDGVHNTTVGAESRDGSLCFDVFNRLVTEEVLSIEYDFSYLDWDDDEHIVHVELTR